jgi:hypothetical protein
MLHTGQNQSVVVKYGLNFFRQGSGAQVKIVGGKSQKGISHTAARGIGRKRSPFQGFDALGNIQWQPHKRLLLSMVR